MQITIAEYSFAWRQMFTEEKMRLQQILPISAVVEHIGSTSVPGLAAKPIIDIMVGLTDFTKADPLVLRVQSLGYEYVSQFEVEMPFRRYFRKDNEGVRTHQIHMVALNSEFWHRHLAFREYLKTHPNIAAEYATLKRKLAEQDWQDVNDYADAKTEFIQSIEAQAS
jgi:GrpB-like predicted nucleotidyltransferase (UPF0157 family)